MALSIALIDLWVPKYRFELKNARMQYVSFWLKTLLLRQAVNTLSWSINYFLFTLYEEAKELLDQNHLVGWSGNNETWNVTHGSHEKCSSHFCKIYIQHDFATNWWSGTSSCLTCSKVMRVGSIIFCTNSFEIPFIISYPPQLYSQVSTLISLITVEVGKNV